MGGQAMSSNDTGLTEEMSSGRQTLGGVFDGIDVVAVRVVRGTNATVRITKVGKNKGCAKQQQPATAEHRRR